MGRRREAAEDPGLERVHVEQLDQALGEDLAEVGVDWLEPLVVQVGQRWLATHGQVQHEGTVDITRTYVKQQIKSRFAVL